MTHQAQLYFSAEEYRARVDAVRAEMRAREADVAIIDEKEHLGYLTGFAPSATMYQALILPLDGDPVMVLRRLDELTFVERTWISEYRAFADSVDPVAEVIDELSRRGLANKRIAFELDSNYLTVKQYQAFQARLPEARFVDFSQVLWHLRLRKSPAEIDYLRQASAIADAAMRAAIEASGEGRSEREAAMAAARTYIELGADDAHVGPIASGQRTDSLHGGLGDHRLEAGDIIHIELIPSVAGYSARMMRPAVIGPPSPQQRDDAARLIAFQDEQFAAMRPGALASDVDRILRQQVLDAGLRAVYDNVTGYTLGYYGASLPARSSDFTRVFLPTSDWTLEAGMVFHMYAWGRGMSFSETVLVTETGHERLTKLERRLFER